jgi:uncharacterized membrane protein
MNSKRSLFVLFAMLLVLSASTAVARATTYTFVDLGPGPKGYIADTTAVAYGVNNSYLGGEFVYTRDSCGKDCSFNVYHAAAWPRSGAAPIDITPPLINFAEAWVNGGAASVLVGTGVTDNGGYFGYYHALLWQGATLAWKDINPTGDTASNAYATNGSQIVGSGASSALHALIWPISNLTHPIDLHPGPNYTSSEAFGLYESREVGYAVTNSSSPTQHAMLWSGSRLTAVDLTPSGVTGAYAYGVGSTYQVGCGAVAPIVASHALLWQGTPASLRDLNPAGFADSCARAVRSGVEVGYGHNASRILNALVWTGTAASAFDLQSIMPSTYLQSEAYAFDSKGDIIGSAFYSAPSGTGWHAIMWIPH